MRKYMALRQATPPISRLKQIEGSSPRPKTAKVSPAGRMKQVRGSKVNWQWCDALSQWFLDHEFSRPNLRSPDAAEKALAKRLHNACQKYGSSVVFDKLSLEVQANSEVRLVLDPRRFLKTLARKEKRTAEENLFLDLCQYAISPRGFLLRWVASGRPLPKSTDTQSRSGAKLLKWIERQGGLNAVMQRDARVARALGDYSASGRILSPALRLQALESQAQGRALTDAESGEMQKCRFLLNPRVFIADWIAKNPKPSRYSKVAIERSMAQYVLRHGGWSNF